MLTDEDILKQAVEAANQNVYMSDSIKSTVFKNNSKKIFKVSIFSAKSVNSFKIISYEKNKNITILFQSKHDFIKNLITNDIASIDICLDNKKINSFSNIQNNIQYKISLFKDNIYNIEIEISED